MTALLVALAGGLGATGRYALESWLRPRTSTRLPWPLLLVNVSGSFALGFATGVLADDRTLLVIGSGLLGGYTTFSGASVDVAERWERGEWRGAVLSAVLMLTASLLAAMLGLTLGRG
ncbi:putative protein CrcB [Aeromicrobium marinum DSM 15272]|uniref:Fluoride-specific ion channel FluC n=1 Tax=Aeromicrobium marinum DSM 15272 TaxID=585531 RepID=E2SCM9_9ACTN|nr:CrcB family protein [Aeromicrobium marinum]EFQ82982.1 putative protein CrcB [Aeromicrobium marinum DSM 15272]